MALHKAGIEATVHEAQPCRADSRGTFLTVATNGVDALRAIGADKPVLAAGFPTPGMMLRSATGKNLGTARTGLTLADGTTSHTLKRADLYQALYDEAVARGISIEHGKRLIRAEESADGVRAVFEDGSDATGEILIGADGVHSAVRRLIDPDAPAPTYAGLINLGGYVRGVEVDAAPGSYTMIFGRRAFFGYTVAPGGEVWWFANVPHGGEPARGEVESVTAGEWQLRLTRLYGGDAGPAAQLIQATETEAIMNASPIHSVPHLPAWHTSRMVVIGDAAHAPTPSSGQGASLAIEDAVVLAQCMRDLPSPQQALPRFEALRRSRAERIIKQAARVNSSKVPGTLSRAFMTAFFPLMMKLAASSKPLTGAYRHHIDWDAVVSTHT